MSLDLWSIVLAAGAGRRLAGVTGGIPKQFWRVNGSESLLEHTLARLAPIIPPSRTVTVIDRSHRRFVLDVPQPERLGQLMYQPCDRGTAAGVLLPLMAVLESNPDTVVVITPSDHGVAEPRQFRLGILEATAWIVRGGSDVVLFAVEPAVPSSDYGWVTPGKWHRGPHGLPSVTGFVEKPSAEVAERLYAGGSVWSTMVLVGRAQALLELHRQHVPRLTHTFDEARRLPPETRDEFLATRYPDLPITDFSRDVLTPARGLSLYVWPASIGWSDLGTPERLDAWRARHQYRHLEPSAAVGMKIGSGAEHVA